MSIRTIRLNRLLICLFAISMALLFFTGCSREQAGEKPSTETAGGSDLLYTVADATGDWGFPSPYGHYARGPGYIR